MMLQGYRIIECGSHIAAPATAGILADWGADVIKVEPARGDPIRWQFTPGPGGDSSPNFEFDNRGKRSVVLDYQAPDGREALARLIAGADIFITNLRPGSARRAGLDYESLAALHPALIYTSISGYGLRGDAADVPAFDITAFWSRSGLGGQMWPAGFAPLNWRPGIGDHVTALAAAFGTVLALLDRTRTGKGGLVESSLLRTGTYTGGFDLADQLRRGDTVPIEPRGARFGRITNYFPVADDKWICVWAQDADRDWPRILTAAGIPELIDDPRFATSVARADNGPEFVEALDRAFGRLTLQDASRRLDAMGIVWAPVQSAEDVVDDEAAIAAGCFVEVDDGAGGAFRAPAPPVRLGESDSRKARAPRLGEHTETVLAELGYDRPAIERARG